MTVEEPESSPAPSRVGGGVKNPKKPSRPDFTARDAKLAKLKEKVAEYDAEAKRKGLEIESLVNETRANNKLEALKRTLANTVHARAQVEVRETGATFHRLHAVPLWAASTSPEQFHRISKAAPTFCDAPIVKIVLKPFTLWSCTPGHAHSLVLLSCEIVALVSAQVERCLRFRGCCYALPPCPSLRS